MSKIVLITGASSGIGEAIATRLLQDGLTVCVAARSYDKMAALEALGAHRYRMDITDEAEVTQVVEQIAAQHGSIEVLINNAGFGCYGAIEDVPIEDARYQFEVNLFGLAHLTQQVLPAMRQKRAGTIINISSMGGKIYLPMGGWYHASKHALEGWSDVLRIELADFGINVVIVEPGIIETGFADVLHEPMLRRSGEGPYGELAHRVAKATAANYEEGQATPAEAVAEVIGRAVRANRPKTRYVVGKLAAPMLFLRKWLPNRLFDFVVMRSFE